jgi:hypothetical protein
LEYCGRTDSHEEVALAINVEEDDAEHTGSRKWVAASLVVDPLSKTYALQSDDFCKDVVRFRNYLSSGIYTSSKKNQKNPELSEEE